MLSFPTFSPEEALDEVRQLARLHLALSGTLDTTPTDLSSLLEALDIPIVSEPFPEDPTFTGQAHVSDDCGFRLIVVNSLLMRPRWSFTVAHETAHIVLDHRPPRTTIAERLANCYAAEILMPRDRIITQIRQYGNDAPLLAGLNGVSFSAMRLRLQELAGELADYYPFRLQRRGVR